MVNESGCDLERCKGARKRSRAPMFDERVGRRTPKEIDIKKQSKRGPTEVVAEAAQQWNSSEWRKRERRKTENKFV